MSLESLWQEQQMRGISYSGGEWVGGDPQEDGAVELLLRHGLPAFDKSLWVNFGCGAWLGALPSQVGAILAWHNFIEDHLALLHNAKRMGVEIQSSCEMPKAASNDIQDRFFRLFQDMEWNWVWLRSLLENFHSDSQLHILGCKDDGIRSVESKLIEYGYSVETLTVGCHSRWLTVYANAKSEIPVSKENSLVSLALPTGNWQAKVPAGVFSSGRLDGGSALLLEHMGHVKGKRVWDPGCGAGILAAAAMRAGATSVLASDHSIVAVESSRENLKEFAPHAKTQLTFLADHVEGEFDLILTNPPFHMERREIRTLGEVWLKALKSKLAPHGEIRLVANAFLPYDEFAKSLQMKAETLARGKAFKVWRVYK